MKILETFVSTRRNEEGEKNTSPAIIRYQLGLIVSNCSFTTQRAAVKI